MILVELVRIFEGLMVVFGGFFLVILLLSGLLWVVDVSNGLIFDFVIVFVV